MQGLAGDVALTIGEAALLQPRPVIVEAAGARGDLLVGAWARLLDGAARVPLVARQFVTMAAAPRRT